MELVPDVIDEGAKEIHVCGVAAVEAISKDLVRVTYFVTRKYGNTVAIHLLWGMHDLLGWVNVWDQARPTIMWECAEVGRVTQAFARIAKS